MAERRAGISDKADAAMHGWQVRSTYDESFLYIRIESATPMPAPGSQAEKPPTGWPVMKVAVSGVGEFVVHANANIGDQATFDESGRANNHRHYVAYWLMLERAKQMVFQAWADLQPNPAGPGWRQLFRRAHTAADDGHRRCEPHENHDRRRGVAEECTFQP